MADLTLERYDKNATRALRDGQIVAMVLRLANGLWRVYDKTETRCLLPLSYISPKAALKALKIINPQNGDA